MSIYEDILRAQVKQGNFGGKKGPFAYLVEKRKAKKKEVKAEHFVEFTIDVLDGTIYKSTDSNGLSDPYVRVGKQSGIFKWMVKTPAESKTLSPKWNFCSDELVIDVNKYHSLAVELWDKDALKDDLIGRGTIPISSSMSGLHTVQCIMEENGKTMINGVVTIRLSKTPFSGSSCM